MKTFRIRVARFSRIVASIALALALGLGLGACSAGGEAEDGSGSSSSSEQEQTDPSEDGIPNPVVGYPTLADASAAAGFEMSAPDQLAGFGASAYDVIDGTLIQVVYGDEGQLTVRKGADETDISGVYETYVSTDTVYVGDITATCQGNGSMISLVTWVSGGHFFSAYSTEGLTMDTAYTIVSSVQ